MRRPRILAANPRMAIPMSEMRQCRRLLRVFVSTIRGRSSHPLLALELPDGRVLRLRPRRPPAPPPAPRSTETKEEADARAGDADLSPELRVLEYDLTETRYESERTAFRAEGIVKTTSCVIAPRAAWTTVRQFV